RPQLYWDVFNTVDNANAYAYMGYPPGEDGLTPSFLLDTTQQLLAPFDREIRPLTSAAPRDPSAFAPFVAQARELELPAIGVWRYGVMTPDTLACLGDAMPAAE